MNRKIGKSLLAATIVSLMILGLGQSVHAQTPSVRYDRASYVPGDSGTVSLTFVNNDPSVVIQIKNVTIYWPWAGFGPDGKWQSGSNTTQTFTNQFVPTKGGTFVASASFTVPTWFGTNEFAQRSNCGSGRTQYSTSFVGCILIGSNLQTTFDSTSLTISMASATYTPFSLVSQTVPIATLIVLAIATAFLALTWSSLRRANKK